MNVTVFISPALFDETELLAAKLHITRDELYARALDGFVRKHAQGDLEAAMNRVVGADGGPVSAFISTASKGALARVEW